MANKIIKLLTLFFYVYTIRFAFIPFTSTRMMLAYLGFILYFVNSLHSFKLKIPPFFLKVIMISFSFCLWGIICLLYNSSNDYVLINKVLIPILTFPFSAYFVIKILFWKNPNFSFISLLKYFVFVCFIQAIISVAAFLIPQVQDFLFNIQVVSDIRETALLQTMGRRFSGLGSGFVSGGIIFGLALLSIPLIFYAEKQTLRKGTMYILFYIVIAFSGICTARITFVSILLSVIFLLIIRGFNFERLIKQTGTLFKIVIFTFLLLVMIVYVFPISNWFANVLPWAFEMFENYFEYGKMEASSVNILMEHMFIFPSQIKTYIIGDGRFLEDDGYYYMGTDVGYLRLIYFSGIIGVILYFLIEIFVLLNLRKLNTHNPIYNRFFLVLFIYLVILNVKGLTSLLFFTILLLMFFYMKPRQNHKITTL